MGEGSNLHSGFMSKLCRRRQMAVTLQVADSTGAVIYRIMPTSVVGTVITWVPLESDVSIS